MPECTHHWIINNNHVGVCKLCGKVKEFKQWKDVGKHFGFRGKNRKAGEK